MRYALLIHSHPTPWQHPTADHVAEYQAQPAEVRDQLGREFDEMLADLRERGELVDCVPLADPALARTVRWTPSGREVGEGSFPDGEQQFAGWFLVDVADEERALAVARAFSGPGEVVELRPVADA